MSLASRASGLGRLDRLTIDNTILSLPGYDASIRLQHVGLQRVGLRGGWGRMLVPPFPCPCLLLDYVPFVGELYHCPRMPETDDLIFRTSMNRILTSCAFALADGGGRMLQG